MSKTNTPPKKILLFGIGAQKAGTTWLAGNLKLHPEVQMTPWKEIHYLDYVEKPRPLKWLISSEMMRAVRWRKTMRNTWKRLIRLNNVRYQIRTLRLGLVKYRIEAVPQYVKILSGYPNKLTADVTPAYAMLSPRVIKALYQAAPDAKIVFIMRDPIDRHWSAIRMKATRFRKMDLNSLTKESALELIPPDEQRNRYLDTIQNWSAVYPASQIHLCFYEQLCDDPLTFFNDILRFSELTPVNQLPVPSRMNEGKKRAMPDGIEEELAMHLRDEVEELAAYFDGKIPVNYPKKWLERIESVLAEVQ